MERRRLTQESLCQPWNDTWKGEKQRKKKKNRITKKESKTKTKKKEKIKKRTEQKRPKKKQYNEIWGGEGEGGGGGGLKVLIRRLPSTGGKSGQRIKIV